MSVERELGIVNAVAEALHTSPNVRQALERTLSLVADLLGLRTGWVWLMDQETGHFYAAAERELPPYLQERVRMAGRRRCWCIDDFRAGELTPTNIDVIECSRLEPAFRGKSAELAAGLRYHASIPLYFQDKPLGIMNVTGPEWRKLTSDELRLLSTIAYQVGIAIERARLAEDATRLARAEERTRIAREIHDTLAQGLTAIALNIEGAMHRLETRPDQASERLPMRVESELFRIAQEALTNVRKHAHATHAEIGLKRRGNRVSLTISDDGRGFSPVRTRSDGQGLVGMRERAKLLGGRLRVSSGAGKGT